MLLEKKYLNLIGVDFTDNLSEQYEDYLKALDDILTFPNKLIQVNSELTEEVNMLNNDLDIKRKLLVENCAKKRENAELLISGVVKKLKAVGIIIPNKEIDIAG